MSAAAAGAAAAAAAAERARRLEEEEMTPYTSQDLAEGWEFKILRANFNAFRKPEVLRQVIEEESRAGWVLLEKFDDARLRFKRPMSARAGDSKLEVDPYRSLHGIRGDALAAIIVGSVAAIILVVVALVQVFD